MSSLHGARRCGAAHRPVASRPGRCYTAGM